MSNPNIVEQNILRQNCFGRQHIAVLPFRAILELWPLQKLS